MLSQILVVGWASFHPYTAMLASEGASSESAATERAEQTLPPWLHICGPDDTDDLPAEPHHRKHASYATGQTSRDPALVHHFRHMVQLEASHMWQVEVLP